MMSRFLLLALAWVTLAARATAVSPMAKVLQLMSEMQTKIIAEGEAAQASYAVFSEMCEARSSELGFEVKTAKAEVADLKATIEEQVAIASVLDTKVGELSSSIATDEADLKAATEIRKGEAADFAAQEKELAEVVSTLEHAIGVLEKEMATGSSSMLEIKNSASVTNALNLLVQASAVSSADETQLGAFVQSSQESEDNDAGAPDAAAYKGHSGGIVDTLSDLLEKAEGQLSEARNKETESLHSFEMLKQSLTDKINFENKELAAAKQGIAACSEKKATAEGDLEVTSKDLNEDVKALADLHHDCMTKAQDYEEETHSRGEELKAIATAKKVLEQSTGRAALLSYGPSQVSFLQRPDAASFQAVRFVRDLARKQASALLTQLAARMASAMQSSDDPFAKVKGLISDMIEKLEAAAESDATEKAFCDKEMSESHTSEEDKTTEIKKLETKIDGMTSRSAQLKAEVAELQKALSALTKTQAEMDKLRAQEKADYTKAKAEMEKGIKGVQFALQVLREYFAQDKSHAADEGAGAGIIGLLEVVESDFSKGLIESTSVEDSAEATYEQETKENEIEKATKEQDVTYKTEEAAGLDKAVAEAASDRSGVQDELDAVVEYLKGLEGRCVAKAETHSERKARIEAELAGLKEALQILDGETMLLQKSSKRALRGVQPHRALA